MEKSICDVIKYLSFSYGREMIIDLEWKDVFSEFQKHAIVSMFNCMLSDSQHIPSDIYKLQGQIIRQQVIYQQVLQVQDAIYGTFDTADIPFVVLKGTSAGKYYPDSKMRTYGDIDLLVLPKDYEIAIQCLNNLGAEIGSDDRRHIDFLLGGIRIELHRFFTHQDIDGLDICLDEWLYTAIPYAIKQTLLEKKFYSLPDLENGLVLLYHIKQHLKSGIGFRQILDWMFYVDKVLDDDFWETKFREKVEKLGLVELAKTVTRACQIYFGLPETITWCKDADEKLCEDFMEYVSARGNFGAKDADGTVQTMYVLSSEGSKFKRLQARGEHNWKLLKKHPGLKPFAWFYQLCRYIYLGMKRKHPIRSLIADIKENKRRKKLMNLIGL